jgi:hypothetical protein
VKKGLPLQFADGLVKMRTERERAELSLKLLIVPVDEEAGDMIIWISGVPHARSR